MPVGIRNLLDSCGLRLIGRNNEQDKSGFPRGLEPLKMSLQLVGTNGISLSFRLYKYATTAPNLSIRYASSFLCRLVLEANEFKLGLPQKCAQKPFDACKREGLQDGKDRGRNSVLAG